MSLFDYIFMKMFGQDQLAVPKETRITLFMRAIVGFGGVAGYYTAIKMTSLSRASVLFFTYPLFTAINARLFLGESISYYDWMAIVFAFIGIVMLQNPFGEKKSDRDFTLDTIG